MVQVYVAGIHNFAEIRSEFVSNEGHCVLHLRGVQFDFVAPGFGAQSGVEFDFNQWIAHIRTAYALIPSFFSFFARGTPFESQPRTL